MSTAAATAAEPARDQAPHAPVRAAGAEPTDAEATDLGVIDGLIAARRVSAADRDSLLAMSRAQGQRLGRLLLNAGILSQEGLRDALAERLGLPVWDPPEGPESIDASLATLLPAAFLRFNAIAPVAASERTLTLAMAWPPDEALVDSVRRAVNREVVVVAASSRQIEAALDRLLSNVESGGDDARDVRGLDAETLRDLASEAPVVQFLTAAIERAVALRASDIHLERTERQARLRYRVDGELLDVDSPPAAIYPGLVSRIKIMAKLDVGERRLPQDGRVHARVSGREIDLRVSILPSLHGEDVVLRILDRGAVRLDLDEVGLSVAQRA